MTTLHGYFRSSASFRVRIALNLKGIEAQHAFYHLRKNEQSSPDYLRLNPQGLVPSLTTDEGVLTQSLAIIEYLDETHPEPPLLPPDPHGRARVRALAQVVACDIHPIDNLRILTYLRGPLRQDESAVQTWFNHWIALGFAALNEMLDSPSTGKFCHGDRPTLADICLVPQMVNSSNFGLDLEPYPRLRQIFDNALAIPAFSAALPKNQRDAE